MTTVEIRLTGVSDRKHQVQKKLAFSEIDGGDVAIRSLLDPRSPVNDHLMWLWGKLQHERRFLKNLQQDGAKLTCHCRVPRGTIRLLPNGAAMLHLLEMEMILIAE